MIPTEKEKDIQKASIPVINSISISTGVKICFYSTGLPRFNNIIISTTDTAPVPFPQRKFSMELHTATYIPRAQTPLLTILCYYRFWFQLGFSSFFFAYSTSTKTRLSMSNIRTRKNKALWKKTPPLIITNWTVQKAIATNWPNLKSNASWYKQTPKG